MIIQEILIFFNLTHNASTGVDIDGSSDFKIGDDDQNIEIKLSIDNDDDDNIGNGFGVDIEFRYQGKLNGRDFDDKFRFKSKLAALVEFVGTDLTPADLRQDNPNILQVFNLTGWTFGGASRDANGSVTFSACATPEQGNSNFVVGISAFVPSRGGFNHDKTVFMPSSSVKYNFTVTDFPWTTGQTTTLALVLKVKIEYGYSNEGDDFEDKDSLGSGEKTLTIGANTHSGSSPAFQYATALTAPTGGTVNAQFGKAQFNGRSFVIGVFNFDNVNQANFIDWDPTSSVLIGSPASTIVLSLTLLFAIVSLFFMF